MALERAQRQRNHEGTNFEREDPTVSTQPVVAPKPAGTEDFMPLHGIDHIELYVGNALQSAFFYVHALGFREIAYAGLETGMRDRASYVGVRPERGLTPGLDATPRGAWHLRCQTP